MSYDAHRPKESKRELEASAAKAALRDKRKVDDLLWLLSHEQGRRIAWQWMGDAGVFRNPFTQSDAQLAFNCGAMNEGQRLLDSVMRHAPEAFVQMMREAQAE